MIAKQLHDIIQELLISIDKMYMLPVHTKENKQKLEEVMRKLIDTRERLKLPHATSMIADVIDFKNAVPKGHC